MDNIRRKKIEIRSYQAINTVGKVIVNQYMKKYLEKQQKKSAFFLKKRFNCIVKVVSCLK